MSEIPDGSGGASSVKRNAVLEQMASHRSVRSFDRERSLPERTLEMLVEAAQRSSTSSNMQIWSVVE